MTGQTSGGVLVVHHPRDEGFGERIVVALRGRGIEARRPEDAVAAARWSRTVAECQRTRSSRAVVVVAGPALDSAPGVLRDVELALEAGRPVLAVRTDDASVSVDGAVTIDARDGDVPVDAILTRLAVAEAAQPRVAADAVVPDAFDDDTPDRQRWRWVVPAVGGPLVIVSVLLASSAFADDDDGSQLTAATTTTEFLVDPSSSEDVADVDQATTGSTDVLRATTTVASGADDPSAAPVTTASTAPASPELQATQLQDQLDALLAARPLSFEIGSTSLTAESMATLDDLVALLASAPGLAVEVGGHTDDNGDEASNLTISQLRADAVMAQLVNRGADPARLTAVGYGEALPIADNATSEGRAANRRIELTVTSQ